MIDSGLLKAARVLADKNQKELAEIAGVSPATLTDIELGKNNPTQKTERLLLAALAQCGVEIRDGAVRRLTDRVRVIEGDDCYLRLLDDVAIQLAGQKKPELLIFFGDDSKSPPEVIEKYRALRAAGIRMRQLVCEGNDVLMGDVHEYRYVPKDYFLNRVCVVYGDVFAFVVKGDAKRVVINTDAELAAVQRNLFMWGWSSSNQPKESHATERF